MVGDRSRTVLVDMDGVLADFDRRVVEALKGAFPQLEGAPSRAQFHLWRAFPECEREIRAATLRPMFFRALPVIDDAREGWRRIEQAGFTPRVCSSPLRGNRWCAWNKRAWLRRCFGRQVARHAIIDSDKSAHHGVALIDDRCDLRGADRASWQLILFDAPYNRGSDAPRLHGWRDPRLPALLHDALERRAG